MMKKILLSLSLLVLTLSTFAQPFTFGIKGGINSHTITTDSYKGITGYTWQDFKSDTKSGWNLGVFARIGDKVYLQPELVYTLLKSGSDVTLVTSTGSLPPGTYSQTFDVKTIEVPLLFGSQNNRFEGSFHTCIYRSGYGCGIKQQFIWN